MILRLNGDREVIDRMIAHFDEFCSNSGTSKDKLVQDLSPLYEELDYDVNLAMANYLTSVAKLVGVDREACSFGSFYNSIISAFIVLQILDRKHKEKVLQDAQFEELFDKDSK